MTTKIDKNVQILPTETIKIALCIDDNTLLQYEKQGIIQPKRKNNNAYYSFSDMEKIKKAIHSK